MVRLWGRRRLAAGAVVTAALGALAVVRAQDSTDPQRDLFLAGLLGLMTLLLGWIVVRATVIVRRGEIPDKVRARYAEAARRRGI